MKLRQFTLGTADPVSERILGGSRARRPQPLSPAELRAELIVGALLLLAVGGIALAFDSARDFDALTTVVLVLTLAIASRVRFAIGPGFTTPVQLVFIPMLLLLPPALVPLAVVAGYLLAKLPDVVTGKIHPDRLLTSCADAWFAVGPALVMAVAAVSAVDWSVAPLLVPAFAAQVASDVLAWWLRIRLGVDVPLRPHLRDTARAYLVDAALTPIGMVVAIAAGDEPLRVLVVVPLLGLFAIFAQEREAHIESALQLSSAYRGTALLLGDVLEDKDAYTAHHSHGVVSLSLAVADRIGLDPAARRRVEFGALLHDIGKIAVPAEILNKPGPLDADDWAVMKLHTVEGQQMLDLVGGVLGEVGRVVRSSHEHYDGSGYPDGLAGDRIPIEARIVSCCDAFSAMTTTRSYRKAMSMEAAREELLRNQGSQFDPDVVDALLKVLKDERVFFAAEALDVGPPAPAHSSP
jgi:HD domain